MQKLPGFALYNKVFRDVYLWRWIALGGVILAGVQTERLNQANKRGPQVIDRACYPGEVPRVLKAEDFNNPVANEQDARTFFYAMTKRRLGWSSPTVLRDMQEFLGQCYHTQRVKDLAYLEEEVSSPKDPTRKIKRKDALVEQGVQNSVVFPDFRQIECTQNNDKVWFCMMDVAVIVQELREPFVTSLPKHSLVKATLLPVDFSVDTPSGLVVADFKLLPRKDKDGDA